MIEILIDNKDGAILEIPAERFSWNTQRRGTAGMVEVDFVLQKQKASLIQNGAILRIKDGKVGVFYGYVVEVSGGSSSDVVKVKAVDQLRFLKNVDTFVFKSQKASEIVRSVANRFGLSLGSIEDSIYKLPPMVEDESEGLDVATKAIEASLIHYGRDYMLYDKFGALTLIGMNKFAIKADEFIISDDSLLYEFEWSKSIDKDTVNQAKLVQDNKETGKREVYIARDSGTIKKWGLFQQFRKVDEKMKPAEIKAIAERIIKVKNREAKELDISAFGHWSVQAGRMVPIYIEELGFNQPLMVRECTHNWEEGLHTMDLKLEVW